MENKIALEHAQSNQKTMKNHWTKFHLIRVNYQHVITRTWVHIQFKDKGWLGNFQHDLMLPNQYSGIVFSPNFPVGLNVVIIVLILVKIFESLSFSCGITRTGTGYHQILVGKFKHSFLVKKIDSFTELLPRGSSWGFPTWTCKDLESRFYEIEILGCSNIKSWTSR